MRLLLLALIFFTVKVFSQESIPSCAHIKTSGSSRIIHMDNYIISTPTFLSAPHPSVCKAFNTTCSNVVNLDKGQVVLSIHECEDWFYVRTYNKEKPDPYSSGWLNSKHLKKINLTEEQLKQIEQKNILQYYYKYELGKALFNDDYSLLNSLIKKSNKENIKKVLLDAIKKNDLKAVKIILNTFDLSKDDLCYSLVESVDSTSEIIDAIISKGVSVNCMDRRGWSPLLDAARSDQDTTSAKMNFNESRNFNPTPNYTSIVKTLMDKGADPNWLSSQKTGGSSPLRKAVYRNHYDIAKLLIENGADVNDYDHDGNQRGYTILMEAIFLYSYFKDPSVIHLLLKSNADINYRSKLGYNHHCETNSVGRCTFNGHTALTRAVIDKDKVIVKLLLEAGADTSICLRSKRDIRCPKDLATLGGNKEIIALFESYMEKQHSQ